MQKWNIPEVVEVTFSDFQYCYKLLDTAQLMQHKNVIICGLIT